jgi:hypothetical protein
VKLMTHRQSRQGTEIYLYSTDSRSAVEPSQPPIEWVPDYLFSGVKQPGREVDDSPPFSARERDYLYSTDSRSAVELSQPPIEWVPDFVFSGVKQPGREVDDSPPFSARERDLFILTPRNQARLSCRHSLI